MLRRRVLALRVLLLAAGLLAGCVRSGVHPGLAHAPILPAPLPHLGAVAAGRYGQYQGQTRLGEDSVWVYAARHNGRVLHAETRPSGAAARTVWLAVDSAYRPLTGWILVRAASYRCVVRFVVTPTHVDIAVTEGQTTRTTAYRFATPPRFAVDVGSPVADGWLAVTALRQGASEAAPMSLLRLGACSPDQAPTFGFVPWSVEPPKRVTRQIAGETVQAWELRRTIGPAAAGEPPTRRFLLIDPATAMLLQSVTPTGETALLEWRWTAGQ